MSPAVVWVLLVLPFQGSDIPEMAGPYANEEMCRDVAAHLEPWNEDWWPEPQRLEAQAFRDEVARARKKALVPLVDSVTGATLTYEAIDTMTGDFQRTRVVGRCRPLAADELDVIAHAKRILTGTSTAR